VDEIALRIGRDERDSGVMGHDGPIAVETRATLGEAAVWIQGAAHRVVRRSGTGCRLC
jgi:hypothetical protein